MKRITGAGSAAMGALLVGLFAVAAAEYAGYHHFARYSATRAKVDSLKDNFAEMEKDMKTAIRLDHNPEFCGELGRLYLDRALAENGSANAEARDSFLDLAVASYAQAIKINPIDAQAHYDLGRVYMLYNFPLLTYAERGRRYFKRAVELDPSDEYMNVNVLYIYLTQWSSLGGEERDFLAGRLGDVLRYNANFIPRIRDMWKQNFGGTDKLKETLSASGHWPQLEKYF
jgi:tetratricopeptide (TPR) repeat protein